MFFSVCHVCESQKIHNIWLVTLEAHLLSDQLLPAWNLATNSKVFPISLKPSKQKKVKVNFIVRCAMHVIQLNESYKL